MKRIIFKTSKCVSLLTAAAIIICAVFPASAETREADYVSIHEQIGGREGNYMQFSMPDGINYYDYENGMVGVTGYYGRKTDIFIPSSVNADEREYTVACVNHGAFSNDKYIKSITLPDGMLEIHESAFQNMKSIKRIYVPASVKLIEDGAFAAEPQDFRLVVEKGSIAEQYARENDIAYIYYEDDGYDSTTYTLYFLAPEDWFMSDYGALNGDIGCFYDSGEEIHEYPGVKMTYTPDIGQNVFMLEGVPCDAKNIVFNDFAVHNESESARYRTEAAESRNGLIYVLSKESFDENNGLAMTDTVRGDWFTFFDYKRDDDHYGSYKFNKNQPTSYTYYFLAPDEWFDTESGAHNDKVCCYWTKPNENAGYPGLEMTPAPEIGKNVYKIENVPIETTGITFNDGYWPPLDERSPDNLPRSASPRSISGFDRINISCPYDKSITTNNFNDWIYVLRISKKSLYITEDDIYYDTGTWFTLDDYRNHADYYGTYGIEVDTPPVVTEKTKGKIYFDASQWQSKRLQFYIFDKKTGEIATPYGWTDREMWGSPDLNGTPSTNGNRIFESFEFTLTPERDAYAIFYDPDTGNQLIEMKLDSDSFDKCAYPSGEYTEPSLDDGREYADMKSKFYYAAPEAGDVDFDGEVTSADAVEILRASAWYTAFEAARFRLADLNNDGNIGSDDALNVLRMSMGI